MAWSVHARQIRLAEQLARRQFLVIAGPRPAPGPADVTPGPENGRADDRAAAVVIDGPETVVAGEQARYRVRSSGGQKVVSWAVGGGPVSQAPDPAHPDELLLVPEQPGNLTVFVRVREGMRERRATKAITAVADVTDVSPPFPLRLFLHGWGLVAVAVVIIGLAAALDALGTLASSGFIALASLMAALLGVITVARGPADARPIPAAKAPPGRDLNGLAAAAPGPAYQPEAGKASQPHAN
jgi:hypothetical protein